MRVLPPMITNLLSLSDDMRTKAISNFSKLPEAIIRPFIHPSIHPSTIAETCTISYQHRTNPSHSFIFTQPYWQANAYSTLTSHDFCTILCGSLFKKFVSCWFGVSSNKGTLVCEIEMIKSLLRNLGIGVMLLWFLFIWWRRLRTPKCTETFSPRVCPFETYGRPGVDAMGFVSHHHRPDFDTRDMDQKYTPVPPRCHAHIIWEGIIRRQRLWTMMVFLS